MSKQKEITIKQFIETPEYAVLNNEMKKSVNHNNVMFNTELKSKGKVVKCSSNLISREFNKKTEDEVLTLKKHKKEFKSKSFNIVHKIQEQKKELIKSFLSFADKKINFNLSLIIT